MRVLEFIKGEFAGWEKYEKIIFPVVILLIIILSLYMKDSKVALVSAICGISYTMLAGKGKISCYFFGLLGSLCYVQLAFNNSLWGNMLLYLCYYIPMQIIGIFKWKQHLKTDTSEIIKIRLTPSEKLKTVLIATFGCIITILILFRFNDKNPVIDGITAFLSILGMYLTVKRAIEQWIIWMIVNGLSLLMWMNLVINGTQAYSTILMWFVYFILSIYFYVVWKKELQNSR